MASKKFKLINQQLFRNCPVYFNWCFNDKKNTNAIIEMRQCASKYFLHRYPKLITTPVRYFLLLLWPLNALRLAYKFTRLCGLSVRKETNKSLIKQFFEQYYIAIQYFISPRSYYAYRFFEPENKADIRHYLLLNPSDLFAYLNCYQNADVINNKLMFSTFCEQKGIPIVPSLAWFNMGVASSITANNLIDPERDVIVKPVTGSKGDSFMLWEYKGNGFYQALDQPPVSWDHLIKKLASLSKKRELLLQPRLFNHPLIADLSNKALISARIVTYKSLSGKIEFFAAVLQIPLGNRLTNNIGIVSPINKETGKLGDGWLLRPLAIQYQNHPSTNGLITGRKIPFWGEAVELTLKAHAELDDFISLGWDIAFTEKGPLLLEGNIAWDIDIIQRPHNMPFGKTKFAEMVLSRLIELKNQS